MLLAFKLIRNLNSGEVRGSGTAFPLTVISSTAGKHSQVEGRTRNMRERVFQTLFTFMGDISSLSQKY